MRGGRAWPQPPEVGTIHGLGDVHYKTTGIITLASRGAHIADDLNSGDVPDVDEHLFLGDITDMGTAPEDAAFQAWAATLPGSKLYVIGNHDVGLNTNTRTPDQWATAYGTPGGTANYVTDLSIGVRLIAVTFDTIPGDASTIRLSDATMAWLDAQLTAAGSTPCFVACHSPLYDTVGGDTDFMVTSTDAGFFALGGTSAPATDSEPILDLLASHPNAVAWISGHTHSPIEAPNIVTGITVGARTVAAINTSAVAYTGKIAPAWGRPCSPYITYLGDRIEVRWRDHFRKRWVAPHGNPAAAVMTVTY
jgi:hypothetical protein